MRSAVLDHPAVTVVGTTAPFSVTSRSSAAVTAAWTRDLSKQNSSGLSQFWCELPLPSKNAVMPS
jgi:hypothetical protein